MALSINRRRHARIGAGFFVGLVRGDLGSGDELIEACNAVADSDKRLACLKQAFAAQTAAATPQAQSRDESKKATDDSALEQLKGKYLDFDAAITTGVSLRDYQAQLVTFSQAVARYKAATSAPLPVASKLDGSVTAFRDAAEFWEASIRFYARSDNRISYGGGLPIDMVGMRPIANAYARFQLENLILGHQRWRKSRPRPLTNHRCRSAAISRGNRSNKNR